MQDDRFLFLFLIKKIKHLFNIYLTCRMTFFFFSKIEMIFFFSRTYHVNKDVER